MKAATAGESTSTQERLQAARRASGEVGRLTAIQKDGILAAMRAEISRHHDEILTANALDIAASDLTSASRDRLLLTPARIAAMEAAIDAVRMLPDPVGEVLADWTRPNGLRIRKVQVPLGVVGIIYESRPNARVDAASPA